MIIDGTDEIDVDLRSEGGRLWMAPAQLEAALGWQLKPEGLCRGAVCLSTKSHPDLVDDRGDVDVRVFAQVQGRACAFDPVEGIAVFGESSEARRALAAERLAPDFELPDLDGHPVSLRDFDGKKRVIATWASWCGCRYDLPAWQALHAELPDLQIISIALDNTPEAAREFVEAVEPDFPVLVDAHHTIAEVYGLYNVPSVVWVDEAGKVARAPVIAPGDDTWRDFTSIDSSVHHDQLRTWVATGDVPADPRPVEAHMADDSPELQRARAERRLGAWLVRHGRVDAGRAHLDRAVELAPFDFTIVRGSMPMQGEDPFGERFFTFWQDWEAAGRPGGYSSADHVF